MVSRHFIQRILPVLLLLLPLSHAGQLRAAETAVTGIVVQSGLSGVMLRASGGAEPVKYRTGKETAFTPRDYRPGTGDTVTVRFHRQPQPRGKVALVASALILVSKAPARTEIASPAVGIVRKVGRKRIRFEFPALDQVVTMEMRRGTRREPERWRPAVGDRVRVYYEKVPARFVRKTVLVINRLERI